MIPKKVFQTGIFALILLALVAGSTSASKAENFRNRGLSVETADIVKGPALAREIIVEDVDICLREGASDQTNVSNLVAGITDPGKFLPIDGQNQRFTPAFHVKVVGCQSLIDHITVLVAAHPQEEFVPLVHFEDGITAV